MPDGKILHPLDHDRFEPYLNKARELFVRDPHNPILQAKDMPVPSKAVLNPGACLIDDQVLLLLRVIDLDDHSSLFVARSENGITDWKIEPTPLLSYSVDSEWYDDRGCEDPRITYLTDEGRYIITYVGFSRFGAGVCLAETTDFKTAKRLGMAIHPYNKDAVLMPCKFQGMYRLLHRPTAGPLEDIWMSESPDLIHWGKPTCVLEESARPGWDHGKVGAGPTPMRRPHGWMLIFHGVRKTDTGWEYRFGIASLDKDEPSTVRVCWPDWVFGPSEPYEFNNVGNGIIFPTGSVIHDGSLMVYYGAGDTSVALAAVRMDDFERFRDQLVAGTGSAVAAVDGGSNSDPKH